MLMRVLPSRTFPFLHICNTLLLRSVYKDLLLQISCTSPFHFLISAFAELHVLLDGGISFPMAICWVFNICPRCNTYGQVVVVLFGRTGRRWRHWQTWHNNVINTNGCCKSVAMVAYLFYKQWKWGYFGRIQRIQILEIGSIQQQAQSFRRNLILYQIFKTRNENKK